MINELLYITDIIVDNLQNSSWIEAVAVIFGLASVWFARKENIWVYPTGIINVLIYVYLCFHAKLYAEMGINAFYFVMSVYGWYNWGRTGKNKVHLPISKLNFKSLLFYTFITLVFYGVLYFVLANFTDSNVPVWDALATAIFITGMLLMAFKKIENWIAWIIGDIIAIPLYAYKGLALTGIQYAVFLLLAVMGWVEWRRRYAVGRAP
jgi:nicotinamide mononucleotide transporter